MNDEKWVDRRVTYTKDGRGFSASPKELLITAARMERDGWSLARIRSELSLGEWVTDQQLRNALKKGHELLTEAIRKGEEPEESRINVDELLQKAEVEYEDQEILKKARPPIWTPRGEV